MGIYSDRNLSGPLVDELLRRLKPLRWRRPCVDYRALNAVTRDDGYSIPDIAEVLDACHALDGSRRAFWAGLDLRMAFMSVPLGKSRHLSAFSTTSGQ